MKRTASLFLALCLLLSVFALASCGKRGGATAGTTAPDTADPGSGSVTGEVTDATTDKWEILAPKVTMLAARDRQLKIECSSAQSAEKSSKNDIYLAGPDAVEDGVTPLIQQMIYERNRAADNLFATTVEYVFWDTGFNDQADRIDLVVKGNAPDAPDLFVNMIYNLNRALLKGDFKDIRSIPGGFFDFSAEGWLTEWMENMSFTDDRAYILGGDYFLDVMRAMTALPFNMTMMDQNAAKLSSAILPEGETLGVNEELTTYFFDLVDRGGWTYDVLAKLCSAIWVDVDGNGSDSIGDVLGIIADEYGGIHSASFIYSCGEKLTEAYTIEDPESEYNGKQWIKYADDPTVLNSIFDAVAAVFTAPGSMSTNYTFSGNTPEKPGAAYHHVKFAASELLFAGVCTLGALEDTAFQEMTDLYSVVPMPKIDVTKEYNTIIINQGDAGSINVNANPRKARVLSAYIQYCTENSPAIRHQFLQIVTKYKTTTYNQGTDRMLNIIYDGVLYDRDKTVEDMNSEPRWHKLMKQKHFEGGASYIATEYASALSSKQKLLDRTLETWYTLPKVEDNAD